MESGCVRSKLEHKEGKLQFYIESSVFGHLTRK